LPVYSSKSFPEVPVTSWRERGYRFRSWSFHGPFMVLLLNELHHSKHGCEYDVNMMWIWYMIHGLSWILRKKIPFWYMIWYSRYYMILHDMIIFITNISDCWVFQFHAGLHDAGARETRSFTWCLNLRRQWRCFFYCVNSGKVDVVGNRNLQLRDVISYMYIYIHTYTFICIYIHLYVYIYTYILHVCVCT
jgi:hypothetical protein